MYMPEFIYTMCLQVPTARRGHWTPRARVTDGCEHPVWVLGTGPRSSARALSAFSCWAISQFLLLCWDGLSLNLDLASFCSLATQFGFGFLCLCALSAVITDDFHVTQLFYGFWDLNSNPHTCTTSILSTELPPQPGVHFVCMCVTCTCACVGGCTKAWRPEAASSLSDTLCLLFLDSALAAHWFS